MKHKHDYFFWTSFDSNGNPCGYYHKCKICGYIELSFSSFKH